MRYKVLCLMMLSLCLPAMVLGAVHYARIVDEAGSPIAKVLIQGGKNSAFSDDDGYFTIKTEAAVLRFSRLGYHQREIPAQDLPAKIVLRKDPLALHTVRVYDHYQSAAAPALDARIIYPDTNSGSSSADLLLKQHSITSPDSPLTGEFQSLSILGNLSRHTLVLLDGVAVNSAGEAFDFSRIPASQISYIEIIKGSSSVYGGSSAIGGIINIVTASPGEYLKAELETGFGSFGMNSQRYLASLARADFSISAEYSHYAARNDFKYEPSWQPQAELLRLHNRKAADYFFVKGRYHRENHYWEGILNYNTYLRELPGPISFLSLYDAAEQSGANLFAKLSQVYIHEALKNELSLSLEHKKSTYINLESTSPIFSDHYRQLYYNPLIKDKLSLNLKGFDLALTAELQPVYYDYEQDPVGGHYFDFQDYQDLNAALGGRIEKGIEYGALSSRGSLALRRDWTQNEAHVSWRMEQHSTLYMPIEIGFGGSIGTAFSLPSYFDRHWIGDSSSVGDTDLNSESSFGYHLGLRLKHPVFESSAAYYYNDIEQLIQWRQYFLNGSSWRPFNVGRAKIKNWEFALALFPLKALKLNAGLTHTDARDFSTNDLGEPTATYDKYLVYTPEYTGSLSAEYSQDYYGLSLSYDYVGEQYSTVDNLIGRIQAIELLNFASYIKCPYKDMEALLSLKLNNLEDKRYQIYANIPQPGFNWNLNLSLSYRLNLP
ncbi:MAG: TonB-dependent receptor [Candidatus Cloacimonetes bacterium]|nr:TonB-dependent receptor [Candidatus Cloacimonadota bacterium]MDD3532935.1 TonB-dependent receptor [Candidatus Cloacimonadota bacterium]